MASKDKDNDIDLYIGLLDKWGVIYKLIEDSEKIAVRLTANSCNKVDGWLDFYQDAIFDKSGSFIKFDLRE